MAYLPVRLTIGASLFGPGFIRMPKLNGFHARPMGEFTKSMARDLLVSAGRDALEVCRVAHRPAAGRCTDPAAAGARGAVIIALVLGAAPIEHFNAVGDQLVHARTRATVLAFRSHHRHCVDRLVFGPRSAGR